MDLFQSISMSLTRLRLCIFWHIGLETPAQSKCLLLFLSLANQSLQIETCLTTWRKTIPSFGFALSLVKSYSVKVERVSPEVFNILTSPILAAVALFERSDQGKSFQMGQEETQNRHGDYASCSGWKNNFRMQSRCNKTCVFCKNRYSTVAWFGCFWVSSSLDI